MNIRPTNLHSLPHVSTMSRSWQAAAMFEAIAERSEDWRVFKFVKSWRRKTSYGFVDTRQGDCIRAALMDTAAIVWGYNEGSPLAKAPPTKVADEARAQSSPIPQRLRSFLREPEFDCGGATFCVWHTSKGGWCTLDVIYNEAKSYPFEFLDIVIGDPRPLCQWVREYYERDDLDDLIAQLYQHIPITASMVKMISKQQSMDLVIEQARIIGYPVSG